MTANGTKKVRKPRPQSELELATMRHCNRLIKRCGPGARARIVAYLTTAAMEDDSEPAEVDNPNQLKVPGTEEEELPFE